MNKETPEINNPETKNEELKKEEMRLKTQKALEELDEAFRRFRERCRNFNMEKIIELQDIKGNFLYFVIDGIFILEIDPVTRDTAIKFTDKPEWSIFQQITYFYLDKLVKEYTGIEVKEIKPFADFMFCAEEDTSSIIINQQPVKISYQEGTDATINRYREEGTGKTKDI